jgi:cobalt-zinc-cadmium efflux system outer membrane protein
MKRFVVLLLFCALRPAPRALALDFSDPRAVVAAAVESHPMLARMRAEAAAARERIVPARSLPNPMLMAGVQNKQVDLRDDEMMTMYMVGVSQTLVRPEKREARRDAAELEAQAMEKQVDSARAELERDVLLAWYELATADAQLGATAQIREMIDAVIASARVRYEVGTAMQADVIRAQLQGSDLDQETLRLRGTRRAAASRLLALLGLPTETDVPHVTMPENTDDLAIDPPSTPPADHPAILALQADLARAEAELRIAKLDLRPDLDLEAQYGHRATQRDMFSVTARIELPLRAKQLVEPRVREALLRRDAAKNAIDELRRELTRAMAEAVVAHDEATSQMKFHQEVLVPQAQLAFESTLAAYQTGSAPFDAILTTETDYLRLRLQYFEYLARHAQAVVTYEALRKGARGGA